jgi:hypothetical protein
MLVHVDVPTVAVAGEFDDQAQGGAAVRAAEPARARGVGVFGPGHRIEVDGRSRRGNASIASSNPASSHPPTITTATGRGGELRLPLLGVKLLCSARYSSNDRE